MNFPFANKKENSSPLLWFLGGLLLGATSVYLLDPEKGKRRRHILRDQIFAQGRNLREQAQKISTDIQNRLRGFLAKRESKRKSAPVDDTTLNQRVRSEFGRKIRHVRSIESSVENGVVTLSGPILAGEVPVLLKCVRKVPGVKEVINRLEIHDTEENISGLQGTGAQYLQ